MTNEQGRSALIGGDDFPKAFVEDAQQRRYTDGQYDEVRLSKDHTTELILFPGQYRNQFYSEETGRVLETVNPFYRYSRHSVPPQFLTPSYKNNKRNQTYDGRPRWAHIPCSRGANELRPNPCLPCAIPDDRAKPRVRYAYSAIHPATYHLVETKDGKRSYPKLCLEPFDRDCQPCSDGAPTVPAARRWITLPSMDWEMLKDTNTELQKTCACGGAIKVIRLICGLCGEVIADRSQDRTAFRDLRKKERGYCKKCATETVLKEEVVCVSCGNPRPRTVFSSVLSLKLIDKDKYTQTVLTGTKPAGDLIEQLREYLVPYDLAAILSPLSLKEQGAILMIRGTPELSESR